MKKLTILFLGLIVLLGAGCPVGLDYPIDEPGRNAIDKALVGTWECQNTEGEVRRAKISKADDTSYDVVVLERGEMYALETDNLKAWIGEIDKATFLFLKPDGEEKYYHYVYHFDGNDLVTSDVALLVGGIDAVTSTEALRKEVKGSMADPKWAEEKTTWVKE